MHTILLISLVTLITIGSQLILKRGISDISIILRQDGALAFIWSAATSPTVIAALALQGIGYIVWWFVISQERLSIAFAVSGSFFYLTMAGASWLIYGERLNTQQWVGISLITIGVLMINLFKDA